MARSRSRRGEEREEERVSGGQGAGGSRCGLDRERECTLSRRCAGAGSWLEVREESRLRREVVGPRRTATRTRRTEVATLLPLHPARPAQQHPRHAQDSAHALGTRPPRPRSSPLPSPSPRRPLLLGLVLDQRQDHPRGRRRPRHRRAGHRPHPGMRAGRQVPPPLSSPSPPPRSPPLLVLPLIAPR